MSLNRSKLLEVVIVKEAVILNTAKSNSRVESKSDQEFGTNDNIIKVKLTEADKNTSKSSQDLRPQNFVGEST